MRSRNMTTYQLRIAFIGLMCVLLLPAYLAAQEAVSAKVKSPLVGMRIEAVDAGLQRLSDNRFVQGERILIPITLMNQAEMDRVDGADREAAEQARRVARGEAQDEAAPRPTPAPTQPIKLGTKEKPWYSNAQYTLRTTEGQPVLAKNGQVVVPTWLPAHLQKDAPAEELSSTTTECWGLDSTSLAAGQYRLSVRLPLPVQTGQKVSPELTSEVGFAVIGRDKASPAQLARVALRAAQAAEKAGKPDEVLVAAEEAIRFEPKEPFDLATLYILIGGAHEAKGELQAAIDALTQAKQIAETQMPGRTHLPELTQARIARLQERMKRQ
jgi:hypothetical protein